MIIPTIHRIVLISALLILLLFSIILAIMIGATDISISDTLDGLRIYFFGETKPFSISTVDIEIINEIRLPRALLGTIVGAGLGISGLTIQSLLRNPLGDPYILGISSGASTGAALVIVLGGSSELLSTLGVTVGAFLGALAAIVAVGLLAISGGRTTPTRIIFAGMAVTYFFSAITSLITLMAKNAAGTKSVMFWTLGSLGSASWKDVSTAGTVVLLAFILLLLLGRRIDLLELGDDTARSLGTNPSFYRNFLIIIVAFTVATLVSLTGSIGFIGLVIPHLAKYLVGSVARVNLPICALLGALLVVIADTFTRMIIRPAELPIGILTALVGTPMLMSLVKNRNEYQ